MKLLKHHHDNYAYLTTAPVQRVILTMAVPTIASMLVTNIYNMADTYFVGEINTQCTAAVGIVFSIMAIIQAAGFFFGHGSGNYISRHLGAKQPELASKMAATGFVYSVSAGLLIMFFGLLFLRPLALLLGATPTVLPYAERYLGIILIGAPFMTASLTMNNQMRLQGNAAYAMLGILTGAALNVALDPLFIFGLGMGIAGAATATVISQVCGFTVLLLMTRREGNIRINLRNFSASPSFLKEIAMGGSPSLMRQGLGSLSTIMLNVAASAYGDAAIAGMTVVNRISYFIYASVIGLGQGFQPLCGFCFGARLYGRVRAGFDFCVKLGTAFITSFAILCFVFAKEVVFEFQSDPSVVEIAAFAFRCQLLTYPLIPFIVTTNMFLQTIRKTGRANLVAAARNGLFFVPLIIVLPLLFGLTGVEVCQPVSDICAFSISVPIALATFRQIQKTLNPKSVI